jgi:hypothetical protein
MTDRTRWIIIGTVTAVIALVVCLTGPVAQWPDYHDFADRRTILGVPNFWDVVSNLPFLLVGFLGFFELRRQRKAGLFEDPREVWPYGVFFLGVFLSGIASTYYHLEPGNDRLFWDRLPIVLTVVSLVSIVLMEKVSLRAGLRVLVPLTFLGVLSIFHWTWTGDLRTFGFVQFYPIIFIGLVLWLFPKSFPAGREMTRLAVYYTLAKVLELRDGAVYSMTGSVSGHTLKHLLAAFAVYWVVRMLHNRKKVSYPTFMGGWPKLSLAFLGFTLLGSVLFVRSMVSMPGTLGMKEGVPADPGLKGRLRTHVDHLATTIGERNVLGPKAYEGLKKAAGYIRTAWRAQGWSVQEQDYETRGREVWNLFVEKKGTVRPEEILVIGAHYDSCHGSPAANDNGSGVATLLELSRALAKTPTARTLRFVAFTNEEPPFFQTEEMGSRVHASLLGAQREKVVGMISLETMGHYSEVKGSQQYPWPFGLLYPDKGNFIAFVGNYGSQEWVRECVGAFRAESDFPSEGVAAPGFIAGIGWSDHWSFWREGYPALMVTDTAPFRYDHYHTPEDTPDKLDFASMARVVDGLQKALPHLAQ